MTSRESRTSAIEERALQAFILICLFLSFFKPFLPWLEGGLAAALFGGIFFLVKQLRDVRSEISRLGEYEEIHYETSRDFYSSAASSVGRARHLICASYFIDTPPVSEVMGREAANYFASVLRFARKEGCEVRRLIAVRTPAMAAWAAEQYQMATTDTPRYYVRVLPHYEGLVEPMNVLILDKAVVYVAFAGGTDSDIGGVQAPGPKFAEFLQDRFERHWKLGIPMKDYVKTDEFRALVKQGAEAS